jgi:hypothetical protein
MRRDEQDEMTDLIRQELGAEVGMTLDRCLDDPILQGEAAQMTIGLVRDRLNAIFVSQEDDD